MQVLVRGSTDLKPIHSTTGGSGIENQEFGHIEASVGQETDWFTLEVHLKRSHDARGRNNHTHTYTHTCVLQESMSLSIGTIHKL